jgi:hypothetical protein
MNIRSAISLCVLSSVLGVAAILVGALPFVAGLHDVTITGMQLGPEDMERLKNQPGGQTVLNCALASVALANQGAKAYNSLAGISRTQSLFLIVGGSFFALSHLSLLYWLGVFRRKVTL